MPQDYDALLIVSFGGPEGMHDVMPFLENVTRGRRLPHERLLEVAKHYELFDGVSPINEQNRQLVAALKLEFEKHGPALPIYWGNRNWHPLLPDTLRQMRDDGVKHALALVTSAYSSYSSCSQYLENIADARGLVGERAPRVDKIRAFYNHPLFIEANVQNVCYALEQVPEDRRPGTRILFTAHSIPRSMADNCEYETQLHEASELIAESVCGDPPHFYALVYQSRSGQNEPWLGPDICDYLKKLSAEGTNDVVIAPIGFISDHMEILYDLEIEARQLCDQLGLNMVRAATAGSHPLFIKMVRELIMERIDPALPRRFLGASGPGHDVCPPGCCAKG